MSIEEIKRRIPHRGAMLLLDEIADESGGKTTGQDASDAASSDAKSIVCRKTFRPDEFYFDGHFPDSPIVPGVIQCECCLQAGAVLLAGPARDSDTDDSLPVATRIDGVKFKRMIHPGDTAEISVKLKDQVSSAYYMTGKVTVGGKLAARLDFTVTMTQPSGDVGSSASANASTSTAKSGTGQ